METAKIRKIGQRPIFLLNFMEISHVEMFRVTSLLIRFTL